MKKRMIQLIVTGGTFDKTYDHIKGELYFEHTHIPKMLKRSRCKLTIHVTPLLLKDSLAFTEEDLLRIEKACTTTSAKSIVITHGTDTMVYTAKRLAQLALDKTIVLTGAMIPYAFGSSSDGFFNLGCALSFSQTLSSNVYITMQGQYFLWDEVQKNKNLGLFEKL
jgi:L-asparaginase